MSDRYNIFIASNKSTDNSVGDIANSITKILNVSIRFHEKDTYHNGDIYYFEDYLDHRIVLISNWMYLLDDVDDEDIKFSRYQCKLEMYFYTEPPTQEYLRMSEAEQRVDSSKRYSEKYNLLLKVAKFTFDNLKSSHQFSLMLIDTYLERKLDEFILPDSYPDVSPNS